MRTALARQREVVPVPPTFLGAYQKAEHFVYYGIGASQADLRTQSHYSDVHRTQTFVPFDLISFWTQSHPIYSTTADEYVKFVRLRNNWYKERSVASSVSAIVMCPSYLGIIGMGEKALPFIFRQLELDGNDPDHWFIALEAITKANPISQDIYGNMPAMAQAWLNWADEHYAR